MRFLLPALLACVLALVPACGEQGRPATTQTGTADGILTSVTGDELTLMTPAGDEAVFALRPIDARRLDLTHLQLHARDQLPSRVFYERDGDAFYAVRVDDL